MSVREVPARALIERLSGELKRLEQLEPPKWSYFVKTGVHRERPPQQPGWWHTRAASILRKIYLRGPIGVSRLRALYGGRQNRGAATEHSRKGSGKIVRTILQQLEMAGLVKQVERKGRKVTHEAVELLDRLAEEIKRAGVS